VAIRVCKAFAGALSTLGVGLLNCERLMNPLSVGKIQRATVCLVASVAIFSGAAGSVTEVCAQVPRQPRDSSSISSATVTRPDSGKAISPIVQKSDSGQLVPLFGIRDVFVAGGFVLGTVLMFKGDEHIAKQSQDKVTQANRFLKSVSKPSELLAWPGGLVIEGGLYAAGKLTHHKRAAAVGWHGTEAVVLAAGITNVLKSVVGRARPYVSSDTNSHDFKFLGGFGNNARTSFPSGHTTTAFALASAVASESRRKWPHQWWSEWLITPALYGGATVVGISRMYHNDHWASDVVLGAAIGTFSGIKTIQYTHDHPNNMVDRVMLHTKIVPTGRQSAAITWSLRAP
jgi:membrane-associated phospholipid phosphatase